MHTISRAFFEPTTLFLCLTIALTGCTQTPSERYRDELDDLADELGDELYSLSRVVNPCVTENVEMTVAGGGRMGQSSMKSTYPKGMRVGDAVQEYARKMGRLPLDLFIEEGDRIGEVAKEIETDIAAHKGQLTPMIEKVAERAKKGQLDCTGKSEVGGMSFGFDPTRRTRHRSHIGFTEKGQVYFISSDARAYVMDEVFRYSAEAVVEGFNRSGLSNLPKKQSD